MEAGSEQAGGFECLKSDSEGGRRARGGHLQPERPISIPSDCVAQIAIGQRSEPDVRCSPLRRVTSDAHGRPSRAEFWAYRRRAQYPAKVTCLVCEVQVSGRANWLAHLNGKKHAKKLKTTSNRRHYLLGQRVQVAKCAAQNWSLVVSVSNSLPHCARHRLSLEDLPRSGSSRLDNVAAAGQRCEVHNA